MSRVVALFDATPRERRLLDEAAGGLGPVEVHAEPAPDALHEAEVAVVFSFADLPRELWADAPRLRWVVSLPAGANHVPFRRLPPQARVVSLHGPNARSLAEHAFALLLAGAKRIVRDHAALAGGSFDQERTSKRLHGATLLCVGTGPIGSELLRLARAFGMRTLAARRSGRPHEHADETLRTDELPDAWRRADFVVLALPLTRETRGLVDAAALGAMKPDAVLVNIARGAIVDRDALAAHIERQPAFTYATDVWWHYPKDDSTAWDEPLVRLDNLIGTPHVGAVVPDWREEMVAAAAEVLAEIAATGEPRFGAGSPARLESPDEAP